MYKLREWDIPKGFNITRLLILSSFSLRQPQYTTSRYLCKLSLVMYHVWQWMLPSTIATHTHNEPLCKTLRSRCSLIWQLNQDGKKAYKHWVFRCISSCCPAGCFIRNEPLCRRVSGYPCKCSQSKKLVKNNSQYI